MKILLICFLFLMIGCKPKVSTPTTPVSVPAPTVSSFATDQKDIEFYKSKFEDEYLFYTGLSIDLSTLTFTITASLNGTGNIGSCSGTTVSLQETFWTSNSTTNSQREQLVFHELKHCAMSSATHNNGTIQTSDDNRSVPASMMNESAISDSFYRKNRTYYLEELFGATISSNPATNNIDNFPESYY